MILMKHFIIAILLLVHIDPMAGQKRRVLADQAYDLMHYSEAIDLYESVFKGSGDSTLLQKIGVCYLKYKNYRRAQQYFGKCLNHMKSNPNLYFKYAELLYITGMRDSSAAVLQEYIAYNGANADTERLNSSISAYDSLMIEKDGFNITPAPFNSKDGDFSPLYYGKQILFTSQRSGSMDPWTGKHFSGLYLAEEDGSDIQQVPIEFAENFHSGSAAFADAKTMYFTTTSKIKGRYDEYNLQISIAGKTIDGKWVTSGLFPYCDPEYNLAYPTLSSDGKTMVFCSDKPGGNGGFDLYVSEYKDGRWNIPIHLKEINTIGDEVFPFIGQDNMLYFASDGYAGLGGLDIYKVNLLKYKESIPANLGSPFNSSYDDFGLISKDRLKSGYLSSNRNSETGIDRIFYFNKKTINP
jgi:tetratricopeptide (TPR) repeat protein